MAAYSYAGLCYASPADVLPVVVAAFPFINSDSSTSIAASPAPTISAAGLVSYRLTRFDFVKNSSTSFNATLQLRPCSNVDLPYDYLVGSGFFGFGFAGVMILFFSAHAIGLVLKAVRDL